MVMKCRNQGLDVVFAPSWGLLLLVAIGVGCSKTTATPPSKPETAVPLERIAIVGASVSAGFGGLPFVDAFQEAAPRSVVHSEADVFLFRDPLNNTRAQIDRAIAFKPSVVVALDLLFWDVYGSRDPAWRARAVAAGLAGLERVRETGAWVVVGDVPHIVTAAEWMLSREAVPAAEDLAALNATIVAWATGRERVVLVPFASWAEPLASGGDVELRDGSKVPASTLVALDGLHANPLGVWALLDRLDHWIETAHPGTPKDALVFKRPATP